MNRPYPSSLRLLNRDAELRLQFTGWQHPVRYGNLHQLPQEVELSTPHQEETTTKRIVAVPANFGFSSR